MDSTDNFSQKKKKDLVAIVSLFGFLPEEKANRMSKPELIEFLQEQERAASGSSAAIAPTVISVPEEVLTPKTERMPAAEPVSETRPATVSKADKAAAPADEETPVKTSRKKPAKNAERESENIPETMSGNEPDNKADTNPAASPETEPETKPEPAHKSAQKPAKRTRQIPEKEAVPEPAKEIVPASASKSARKSAQGTAQDMSAEVPQESSPKPVRRHTREIFPKEAAAPAAAVSESAGIPVTAAAPSEESVIVSALTAEELSVPAAAVPAAVSEAEKNTEPVTAVEKGMQAEAGKTPEAEEKSSSRSKRRGRPKKETDETAPEVQPAAASEEIPTAPFDTIAIEEMIPLANEDRELPETTSDELPIREAAPVRPVQEAQPQHQGRTKRHSVIIKPKDEETSEGEESAEPMRVRGEESAAEEGLETAENAAAAVSGEHEPAAPHHGRTLRPKEPQQEMLSGVLEIMSEGYGFLRRENYLQGQNDIYVPAQYIRRFGLRLGDFVTGPCRPKRDSDRYQALQYIKEVNGLPPEKMLRRPHFDRLTPIYPNEKFILETEKTELSTRIIDLISPIGKGQRGMIVSPPKAGKTILLQKIANAISINNPESKLIVLLIDERPEEVTDMQRSINGEVVYSTFDKTPENHVRITELVLERAMRLVELGQDVVILMDSITRMSRAYNLTINPTGRTLSGGLDPGALYGPKRFFGAARNIEGGGSLTIIATSLIETGSRMDEVIFEEFKGTGNMEVVLDRKLSEKRIFPAIDIIKSGTRREELLLSPIELDAVWTIRKAFSQLDTAAVTEMIISLLLKTNTNSQFISSVNISFNDKAVFDAMRGTRLQGSANSGSSGQGGK